MIVDRWWCMDCRSAVELDRHGRCACCKSEAVDSMERNGWVPRPVSSVPEGCEEILLF